MTGILTLGLHYAAYCAKVYRRQFGGHAGGQLEAATALNFSPLRTAVDVVPPQAISPVVPILGNYLIVMFKDTPLLSAIIMVELLQESKIVNSSTFCYTEPLAMVGILFLVMSLIAAWGVRHLETWLKVIYGGAR